mmetsp:Transcript_7853/g.7433  ORF Transcript_7853/g.7433 Transcript_7853/m.7433 type:complete len:413 (-) Transcript_7853:180-1418(-)|eukprot:CAMPEP_0197823556 /NCGR_PEP_ID=MMETSP1437-20131217/888_1 /TAXON_ID=49252 ORGANISM="Eucampia antarctica, Strain CCMP1452" /NCGR_SAMPLE_ID=MMETSP1437 /ASSEMBLY_ACC=CAM_ASM_001096 /LENGTH=412 /DNA_ID=CAMNT_0043422781 /DNA_START=28 /DNA_END=1266 /DNA_ORIENTATION=+
MSTKEEHDRCKGCEKAVSARLACPKCVKLGIPNNFFCSQECFRANYGKHNKVHKAMAQLLLQGGAMSSGGRGEDIEDSRVCEEKASEEEKMAFPNWAQNYRFTGSLRPARMSPWRSVPASIRKPDYADHANGESLSEQRDRANNTCIRIYSAEELDGEVGLRHACRMGREVLDEASRALRVGVTTDEIDRVVHEACLERDCYPSPLRYYNFPKSVCTSVNEVICHGIPDFREVQDGDIVNLDVTVFNRGGFHGDLNETFLVGQVDDDGKRLVRTAFQCLANALDKVKPGVLYRDLGTVISKTAQAQKCSVVRTYCGHGIGSLFHTAPNIPHYHKNKAKGIIKPGHVFTVEPMINLGNYADTTWDDNWSAVTSDGKRSAQFEHTLLVTETGYELLTGRQNEPVMTWDEQLNTR